MFYETMLNITIGIITGLITGVFVSAIFYEITEFQQNLKDVSDPFNKIEWFRRFLLIRYTLDAGIENNDEVQKIISTISDRFNKSDVNQLKGMTSDESLIKSSVDIKLSIMHIYHESYRKPLCDILLNVEDIMTDAPETIKSNGYNELIKELEKVMKDYYDLREHKYKYLIKNVLHNKTVITIGIILFGMLSLTLIA